MQAGVYLAVLNAERRLKDGSMATGFIRSLITTEEKSTRDDVLTFLQTELDEKFFLKEYGQLVDTSHPAIINFLYIEPN